jgi:hypothetical protein
LHNFIFSYFSLNVNKPYTAKITGKNKTNYSFIAQAKNQLKVVKF